MSIKTAKKLALCFAALMLLLLLTGCSCEHEWQRSTCQAPRTCSRCGETEGKVRAHEWGSTDCHDPKGCIVCGTTEGMELTHTWQDDCRICIHCGLDDRPADDRFPEQLTAGLEERWALENELRDREKNEGYVRTREDWEAMFSAEYSRIGRFREETFQDEAMGEAAVRYISSIEASVDALEHFGTDQWEDEYANGAYWEHATALFLFHSQYPLTVQEVYQKKLERLTGDGEIINMVRPMIDQVMFLDISVSDQQKVYETTLKNTTSMTFLWFSFDVDLLDAEGNVMDTKTIKVWNWRPDKKMRFNFTTDQQFDIIKVAFANWEIPPESR